MNVVIAIDSFKGSLTSLEAGEKIKDGVLLAWPEAAVAVRPLADGGEGTVEALTLGMGGVLETVRVTGPLGRPVTCTYGLVERGSEKLAVIEMSGAAGITLVSPEERNPLHTTTYGVGEVILDAMEKGCRKFLLGIGGSATNDGGTGMLQALGFGLLDREGNPVSPGAKGLEQLVSITDAGVNPLLKMCSFRIACDVSNPLCGPRGCSAVYGPQKGADAAMIRQMDEWLSRYAALCPQADPNFPGAGAAGGLGFAFQAFTNAVLEPGADIVLDETGLEEYIQGADIVVTGEGRLDSQTVMGKAPAAVARLAKKYGKTVLAFSGCVTEDARACNQAGIDAYFPILRRPSTLEEAMGKETAGRNLRDTAEQVFRLVNACKGF